MKKNNLSFQIWITFISIILVITIISSFLYIYTLKNYFKEEAFKTIENAQKFVLTKDINDMKNNLNNPELSQTLQDIRIVQHGIYIKDKNELRIKMMERPTVDKNILDKIKKIAFEQKESIKKYIITFENEDLFVVIRKINKNIYLTSFMWNTYKKEIENNLLLKVIIIIIGSFLGSIFFSIRFSKKLTLPLVKLKDSVNKISRYDWNEEVKVVRNDEIGELAITIEKMRKELIKKDKSQQESLQFISHELKTPVMIIRSYLQSIEDGIFPEGNLISSLKTIDEQTLRLERRIKDLLYFSKLDYLSKHENKKTTINIKNIIFDVIKSLNKPGGINFDLDLHDYFIEGNENQIKIVFENILDNQLRYANTKIKIKFIENKIIIFNDGEKIEEDTLKEIFKPFKKGKNGENGIGLSIVKRIIEIHGGTIEIINKEDGVEYEIKW
ncbi:sensor histidine kinase CssS [Tepiditoga spiralis]|uniref:histidine kinase n=1 Tax=Tepiditoga spiralis TaxID=2108365 RepID=A0A7G1G6S7_9BACT|nr:HAMP domain-containing sensor histidine kinase [Tepiditoga spiralis]BBE30854.1 sensor histidine kinase CssS [Tepiditoga spiralis]